MRRIYEITLLILLVAVPVGVAQDTWRVDTDSLTDLGTDYLGQRAPGLKPELFAPDVVSTNLYQERDATFTRDLKEFYFTRDASIMAMYFIDSGWTEPRLVPFSSDVQEFEPYVAPDQERLYYVSQRPVNDSTEDRFFHIWFVERDGDVWGKPQMLSDQRDYYPTMTTDAVMYFTDANNDLYRSRITNGAMSEREKLSDSINTARPEYNSFVARDESFIIFTSFGWGPGYGGGDLYISYLKDDGTWTQAKNMGGGINTNGHDYCPSLSPDGKYLFYTSNKNGSEDIYWVDAGVIDRLRTEDLNTSDMLFKVVTMNNSSVGLFKYSQLQEKYGECCVFDGRLLVAVGDRLVGARRVDDAVAMMKLGANLHPETLTISQRLKLAVLSDDRGLYDDVVRQLRESAESLGGRQEIQVNALGYRLIGWQKLPEALKILKLNVELFPNSFNVYDSYGEALMYSGDTLSSIRNYEKSLQLNPDNTNAAELIKRLKGE